MALQKLIVLAFLSMTLVGCGFHPLMTGQHETPQKFHLKINGSGYSAYKFRRKLEKQLALTPQINDKAYTVSITLTEGYVPIAYGTDATISRSQLQASTSYSIMDGHQLIATGKATAYSTYMLNYTEEFSTRSAQFAASERTLISLAEELSREIMLKIRSAPEKMEKKIADAKDHHNW